MIENIQAIALTVNGPPRAQMRARASAMGKHARVYKHAKQAQHEDNFVSQVLHQLPPRWTPFKTALHVDFYFYLARPKSHYGTGRNAGKLKQSAPRHPIVKPDFDNTIKHVCDCCNQLVWEDDRLICHGTVHKSYTQHQPKTILYIKVLD